MKEVTKKPSAARSHPYARPPAPASPHLPSSQPRQQFTAFWPGAVAPLVAPSAGRNPSQSLNNPALSASHYMSHPRNDTVVPNLHSSVATSLLADNQIQNIMNTACTFRGCPIVAHAQRSSQAIRKHRHLADGSIPLNHKGTLAYVRHVQGRWTMVVSNENRPQETSMSKQSNNNVGEPNNQMLSPQWVTRTPMSNQMPTVVPSQTPLSEVHPYTMSHQLSGHPAYSAGVHHGMVHGFGVPQMRYHQTVPTQLPQDAAMIGTGAHATRPMQARVFEQPINVQQMMSQSQHHWFTPQQRGAQQQLLSPPLHSISQARQLPNPYLSGADIMAPPKRISNKAESAPYGQRMMQAVQTPGQFPLASSPQQPATALYLAPPLPQQQQPTLLDAPASFPSPGTSAPLFTPAPVPAPLSSTKASVPPKAPVRRKASVSALNPVPTKKAKKNDPPPTTAKPTAPLDLTTAKPRITPIPPPPVPAATAQVKAQTEIQQQPQPATQQAKQDKVESSQINSTPAAEVGRQLPAATPAPVRAPAVPKVTPVPVPTPRVVRYTRVQIAEGRHKTRVKKWWSTNPYGDQNELYLPGSGVPPGVRLCDEVECVHCAAD